MLNQSGSMTFRAPTTPKSGSSKRSLVLSSSSSSSSNPWLPDARQSKRNKSSGNDSEVLVKAPLINDSKYDITSDVDDGNINDGDAKKNTKKNQKKGKEKEKNATIERADN